MNYHSSWFIDYICQIGEHKNKIRTYINEKQNFYSGPYIEQYSRKG